MIISTKGKKKKKLKPDRQTLGQMVKAELYRENHTKKHTHTHFQKEKKEKKKIYIYIEKKKKRKRAMKSINKSTNDNKPQILR